MDFTEFRRRLGAEPRSQDPELVRARGGDAEFRAAAEAAERFEQSLERALRVPAPAVVLDGLLAIPRQARGHRRFPWPAALAAGLLLAAGAWVLQSRLAPSWSSVEDYVIEHYRHDGDAVLARAGDATPAQLDSMIEEFGIGLAPGFADGVRLVKNCPTPDGKGLHMVLDTPNGLVTVIYMPRTTVNDREALAFDGREALLVALPGAAAVIIGSSQQQVAGLYPLVHDSILPGGAADRG